MSRPACHLPARFVLFAFGALFLLSACGGGDSSAPPPTGVTPPPTGNSVLGPPVSITLAAGDGQVGEPLATLVSPVVALVRDSASKPVPNISLSVAIDIGGGTLTTSTAVTGSDGRATIAGWILGPAEGPQTLRITTGALTVTARATALVPATSIPALSVPVSGGTIIISRPGAQLDSTSLSIPTGAYTSAKSVNIGYTSSASISAVAGGHVISPLITVSGLEARASAEMRMTIPIRLTTGFTPIVIAKNPSNSTITTLDLRDFSDTRVTVGFRQLNGATVDNSTVTIPSIQYNSAATYRTGPIVSAAQESPAQLYVIEIPDAEIFRDRLTGFKLADDSWNFRAMPTVLEPATQFGMAASALFYFMRIKPGTQTSLNGAHYLSDALAWEVPYSSWRAMRLVTFASAAAIVGRADRLSPVASQALDADFRAIAANMLISGDKPVPVWAMDNAGDIAPLIVTAIAEGQMFVYDPMVGNGAHGVLVFTPNHRLAYYDQSVSSTPKRYTRVIPVSPYNFYDSSALGPLMASISSQTFGDDKFPSAVLRTAFDTVRRGIDSVYFIDTLSLWSTCDACTGKGVAPTFGPNPPPNNGEVMLNWLWRRNYGTDQPASYAAVPGTELNDLKGGFRLSTNLLPSNTSSLQFIVVGNCGDYACWVDARPASFVFRTTTKLTAPSSVTANTTVSMSVELTRQPPGTIIEWDFGDGSPRQKTGTTLITTHVFDRSGTFPIKVRTYHPRTEQLIGIDSLDANVTSRSWSAWRFTSFQLSVTDIYRALPHNDIPGNITRWEFFKNSATNSPAATQFLAAVLADSLDWFGLAAGSKTGALVYLSKDTISRNIMNGTTVYNAAKGVYYLVDAQVPTANLVMPFGLDPYRKALASPTLVAAQYPFATANACKSAFSNFYTSAGNPLSTANSTINGSVWANLYQTDGVGLTVTYEPRRVTKADVTISGETATGTLRMQYRLSPSCASSEANETPWTLTATFSATRIR